MPAQAQPTAFVRGPLGFVLFCLVSLLWSAPAWSQQAIQLTTQQFGIVTPEGERVSRPNRRSFWISYEDCIEDRRFSFPLRPASQRSLEIWAGTDNCAERRSQQDRGQCWIVHEGEYTGISATPIVPVRALIARRIGTSDPPDESELGPEVCDERTGDSLGEQVTFHFFHQRGGQAESAVTWEGSNNDGTGYDLVGPDPPTSVELGIGENQLLVELDGVDEDADRLRFQAFCVPARRADERDASSGNEPSAEGAAADAGADGGASGDGAVAASASNCVPLDPNVSFVAGQTAPLDEAFECGEGSEFQSLLETRSDLVNGQPYMVAVAAEDLIGNHGPLSEVVCAAPLTLRDFWEVYSEDAGGSGGGGFCGLTRRHQSSGSGGWWLLGLGALGVALRRNGAGARRAAPCKARGSCEPGRKGRAA